jgi:Tfp pilus assembly protein PilN
MIIRSNLASSPIKNYSIFLLGCTALAVAIVLFTFFNLTSLKNSYEKNEQLKKTIATQQIELQNIEQKKGGLQHEIDTIKTPQFVSETEFMNNAIKRRVFSWTGLFDHFEEMLPPSVKMISITPTVAAKNIAINMEMAAQSLPNMLTLVRALEKDPQFSDVTLKAEHSDAQEDLIYFSISLQYRPPEDKKGGADEL